MGLSQGLLTDAKLASGNVDTLPALTPTGWGPAYHLPARGCIIAPTSLASQLFLGSAKSQSGNIKAPIGSSLPGLKGSYRREHGKEQDLGRKSAESPRNNGASPGFKGELRQVADKPRDNMDAAEHKHMVLGLLSLECVSDT